MSKRKVPRTPHFFAVKSEFDAAGVPFSIEHGGKHWKLVGMIGDLTIKIVFPCSTGDKRRGPLKASCTARRIIRAAQAKATTHAAAYAKTRGES